MGVGAVHVGTAALGVTLHGPEYVVTNLLVPAVKPLVQPCKSTWNTVVDAGGRVAEATIPTVVKEVRLQANLLPEERLADKLVNQMDYFLNNIHAPVTNAATSLIRGTQAHIHNLEEATQFQKLNPTYTMKDAFAAIIADKDWRRTREEAVAAQEWLGMKWGQRAKWTLLAVGVSVFAGGPLRNGFQHYLESSRSGRALN